MDIELARIVADDIDFLAREWNKDIDDASLRRASPIQSNPIQSNPSVTSCRRDAWKSGPRLRKEHPNHGSSHP